MEYDGIQEQSLLLRKLGDNLHETTTDQIFVHPE